MKNRVFCLVIVGLLCIIFVRSPRYTEEEKAALLLDEIKLDLERTEIVEILKVINNGKNMGSVKINDKEVVQKVLNAVMNNTPRKKENKENVNITSDYVTDMFFEDENGEIIASIVKGSFLYRGDEYVDLNESLSSIYQWLLEKYENEFVAV